MKRGKGKERTKEGREGEKNGERGKVVRNKEKREGRREEWRHV